MIRLSPGESYETVFKIKINNDNDDSSPSKRNKDIE